MISKNRRRGDTLCASEFVSVPKNGHYCLLRQFPISQDIGHEWTQILNYLNHGVMLKLLSLQKQATWQYSKFRCCLWRQQAPQVNIGCKSALSYFDIFSGDVGRISRIWFIWFLDNLPSCQCAKDGLHWFRVGVWITLGATIVKKWLFPIFDPSRRKVRIIACWMHVGCPWICSCKIWTKSAQLFF